MGMGAWGYEHGAWGWERGDGTVRQFFLVVFSQKKCLWRQDSEAIFFWLSVVIFFKEMGQ